MLCTMWRVMPRGQKEGRISGRPKFRHVCRGFNHCDLRPCGVDRPDRRRRNPAWIVRTYRRGCKASIFPFWYQHTRMVDKAPPSPSCAFWGHCGGGAQSLFFSRIVAAGRSSCVCAYTLVCASACMCAHMCMRASACVCALARGINLTPFI